MSLFVRFVARFMRFFFLLDFSVCVTQFFNSHLWRLFVSNENKRNKWKTFLRSHLLRSSEWNRVYDLLNEHIRQFRRSKCMLPELYRLAIQVTSNDPTLSCQCKRLVMFPMFSTSANKNGNKIWKQRKQILFNYSFRLSILKLIVKTSRKTVSRGSFDRKMMTSSTPNVQKI